LLRDRTEGARHGEQHRDLHEQDEDVMVRRRAEWTGHIASSPWFEEGAAHTLPPSSGSPVGATVPDIDRRFPGRSLLLSLYRLRG